MQPQKQSTENGGEDEKKVQSRNRRFFYFPQCAPGSNGDFLVAQDQLEPVGVIPVVAGQDYRIDYAIFFDVRDLQNS